MKSPQSHSGPCRGLLSAGNIALILGFLFLLNAPSLAATTHEASSGTAFQNSPDCALTSPPTCSYVTKSQTTTVSPTAFSNPQPACQVVTNNCPADIMIPTTSQAEWSSFVSQHENCAQVANCYAWMVSGFGSCSATCGNGIQTQTVYCQDMSTGSSTADSNCTGAKPPSTQSCYAGACATGSWQASTSCSGTTLVTSYSCVGGPCSGPQPGGSSAPNSPACGYSAPSGTWVASTSCSGTTLVTSYSCVGGSCSGPQPAGSSTPNSPTCGYVTPSGTWQASTSCSGTTLVTSYSCVGGPCSGPQPAGSSTPNSPTCGYVGSFCERMVGAGACSDNCGECHGNGSVFRQAGPSFASTHFLYICQNGAVLQYMGQTANAFYCQ